jgi:hypothetical protein
MSMRNKLVCPECWDTFSADPADYFWMHPGEAFTHYHEEIDQEIPLALVDGNEEVLVLEATVDDLEAQSHE